MHCECYATTCVLSFPKNSTRQSFERCPATMEWARFRKYARSMRELDEHGTLDSSSRKILSVIQLNTIDEPLFPNLKTLYLYWIEEMYIPFIPLFLSPSTTSITLRFEPNIPEAIIASTITILPILCPNLQAIILSPPSDPLITAAISRMLLTTNRNTLQELDVDSPLTKEASEVLYGLPNLRSLSMAIERETPLPPASLPNLTELAITCDNEDGWPRLFHGATFGKLEDVKFYPQSGHIGDFLGAFEKTALSSSLQNTLSSFLVQTPSSWNPNYSSLLPFTQLVDLEIRFSCDAGCSSTVDDDIVVSLSQAMPKLEYLGLGAEPCRQTTDGVTTKGLLALAHHCPELLNLRVHLQVASLSDPPVTPGMVPAAGPTASWTNCALTRLEVGKTPVPKGSAMTITLTLLRIFPRLDCIIFINEGWWEVANAIDRYRKTVGCSGKQRHFTTP